MYYLLCKTPNKHVCLSVCLSFDFGFQHLEDIFNETIIPALALVGYELIIANRWVIIVGYLFL